MFPFDAHRSTIDVALGARPPVFAATWARADQDLRGLFGAAHDAGSVVLYQVGTVLEALRVMRTLSPSASSRTPG